MLLRYVSRRPTYRPVPAAPVDRLSDPVTERIAQEMIARMRGAVSEQEDSPDTGAPGLMSDAETVRKFVRSGHATVTLRSKASGKHYTLRFDEKEEGAFFWFVRTLTHPEAQDENRRWTYIGVLNQHGFHTTPKSRMTEDAAPVKATTFFCERVLQAGQMPDDLEVHHDGRCGRCHRQLTDVTSIARGIGPECVKRAGLN